MRKGRVAFLLAAAVVAFAAVSAARGDDLFSRALHARDAGSYSEAISALEQLVADHPDRADYAVALAETLAWDHQYDEALSRYRALLARDPDVRAARLGLARVLLWTGRYADAIREVDRLLERDPNDLDALEARATADYWSGDFRAAEQRFSRVLAADPGRVFSRRSLDAIRSASRPRERFSISDIDDDQPLRLTRADLGVTIFSDPLTRWSASIGSYRADSTDYGTYDLPFVKLENRSVLPSLRLTIEPSFGVVRYADGEEHAVGGLGVSRKLGRHNSIELRAERKELLVTATGLSTHPWVDSLDLGWKWEGERGWSGEARVESLRYFDDNHGARAWAWGLAPLVTHGNVRLRAGLATSFMDTSEDRFRLVAFSSVRDGDSFDYSYRGEYAPYWTPRHLREARAVLVADVSLGAVRLELHGDGGIARDEAVAFGPDQGPSPIPAMTYSVPFDREFHPFRARLSASVPIGRNLTFQAGLELSQTVFYRARNIDVSLVRQR